MKAEPTTCSCCGATVDAIAIDPDTGLCLHCQPCPSCGSHAGTVGTVPVCADCGALDQS